MKIAVTPSDRSIAQLALTHADKRIDQVRTALEVLLIDDMHAQLLQGLVSAIRDDLKDLKRSEFEWSFDSRRALGICLRLHRKQLEGLKASEGKLLLEGDETLDRIGEVQALLDKLAGQESLFPPENSKPRDEAEAARERVNKAATNLLNSGATVRLRDSENADDGGDGEPPTRRPSIRRGRR